jgi:hypothetical protein
VNRQAKRYMSDEHFAVDGTLIQAWASQKSFRPKDGGGPGDGTNFHGQQRSNDTHQSSMKSLRNNVVAHSDLYVVRFSGEVFRDD